MFPTLEEGISTSVHSPLSMRRSCGWYTVVPADTLSDNRGKTLRPPTRCWPSSSFTGGWGGRGERHSLLLLRRRSRDGVSTSPQVAKLVVMMYVNCEMWCFLHQLSEVSSSSKSSRGELYCWEVSAPCIMARVSAMAASVVSLYCGYSPVGKAVFSGVGIGELFIIFMTKRLSTYCYTHIDFSVNLIISIAGLAEENKKALANTRTFESG